MNLPPIIASSCNEDVKESMTEVIAALETNLQIKIEKISINFEYAMRIYLNALADAYENSMEYELTNGFQGKF